MTDIDMKELELKAWKSTFQDGLWDILLGFIFFIPAVLPLISAYLTASFRIESHS